ncbi:MAG: biotin/lipoyl-containing protein, partial [Desulfobacter sp.]
KTFEFTAKFSDPNNLPVDVWFEGMKVGAEMEFTDSSGKPHQMTILDISPPKETGHCVVRYLLDSEVFIYKVKVSDAIGRGTESIEMADVRNIYHIAAPSNGDLWVMYVNDGDFIQKGQEIFNISIMKQEKAVLSPIDGIVKRVLKRANYQETKKMVPVVNGELLVELSPASDTCPNCISPINVGQQKFCPICGHKIGACIEKDIQA